MAKAIRITDSRVVQLVNTRAKKECRSATNAAVATLLEALGPVYGTPGRQDLTDGGRASQQK